MMVQMIISFIGTICFSVLFSAPRSEYGYCGLTGMMGWLCYLGMISLGQSMAIAIFTGTFVLTLMSRYLSKIRCLPLTTFLTCGIFPLVPGAAIYYTAYYTITNQTTLAFSKGFETLSTAVMIALGIAFALSLPQNWFKIQNRKKV